MSNLNFVYKKLDVATFVIMQQQPVLLKIFFKIYASEIQFCSSRRVKHNDVNGIKNKHFMNEIIRFKVLKSLS